MGDSSLDDLEVEELGELIRRRRAGLAAIAELLKLMLADVLPAKIKTLPVDIGKLRD
jgi:hypothetical protein